MKAEQELQKDALAIEEAPTVYTELNAVAVEAEQPCRVQSALQFLAPNGIFTFVEKTKISLIIRGVQTEVIRFNITVNPAHRIDPNNPPPNCTKDGVTFLPAQSVNVRAVAEPRYISNSSGKITNVLVFFTRTNKALPATLGLRVKFEENVSQRTQYNPKRKPGTIPFP
ncbi:MAG TPA: hypothetical protein VF721_06370 [Pyrinomonadaceae bacterium]|jgi:hypothetical protein